MSNTLHFVAAKKPLFQILLPILFLSLSAFKLDFKPRLDDDKMYEICQRREFVSGWAQNFVGIKYRRAGTSPRTGFDCSGFTSYIMKEFDVKVSPCSSTQSQQGERISLAEAQTGDLLFFGRRGHIQHVAIIVENTPEGIVCVHSTSSRGVVVENVSKSDYWAPRIMFARDAITPAVLEK